MNKKLLILGAKGQAKLIIDAVASCQSEYTDIALLDSFADYSHLLSYPIIGRCDDLESFRDRYTHGFVSMADPVIRKYFLERLIKAGYEIPNIVHPTAHVSDYALLDVGIFIDANASIAPDSRIGIGCVCHAGVRIAHDNEISNYSAIAPNACTNGYVNVGNGSFIGSCSCIINNTNVGSNVVVAAGSVVTSHIADNVLVAGSPAKVKKQIAQIKYSVWPATYGKEDGSTRRDG